MYDHGSNTEAFSYQLPNYDEIALIKAKRAQRRYFTMLRWFLIFALVAASSYLLADRPEWLEIDKAFMALAIIWLGFLPSLQYLLDRNRPPMPFFPLVGIFYATSFGLPMFASKQELAEGWSLANVSFTELVLVLLGVAGMTIAFFASKSSLWKKVSPIRLPSPLPPGKLQSLLWLLLCSHLVYLYVPSIRAIPSIGQLLEPIGYIAYGMFYIISSRGKLPAIQTCIVFGIGVPLEIIPRFATGSLAPTMLLGLFMIIVIWYEHKRIPVIFISITLIFLLIFNSVKHEYRRLVWFENKYTGTTPIEKVQLFIELAIQHYQNPRVSSENESSLDSSTGSVVGRTAHIVLFSKVVKDTPSKVPYWDGQTYSYLLTSYVPRALWPDKPVQSVGNNFGRRYNYLGKNDFSTALNLPWIVEMYANFGALGVLAGMPLVGLLLAFIEKKLNHPDMNPLDFVVGATVSFRLVYQESNFSTMIGGLAPLSLVLYVLFNVYLGRRRRRSA